MTSMLELYIQISIVIVNKEHQRLLITIKEQNIYSTQTNFIRYGTVYHQSQ